MVFTRLSRNPRAFTLIELLVSIGIISILIGLLLPALSGAKIRASEVKVLSELRQIGVSMQLYVEDAGGLYPYFPPNTPHFIGPPEDPLGVIYVGDDDPWSMSYFWVTLMHRVAPWQEHYASWTGVGRESGRLPWLSADVDNRWLPPGYVMSNSFVASPGTWSDNGVARIQSIRAGQVRYPSAKVIFYDGARAYLIWADRDQYTRGVLLSDGSARGVLDADAATPVQNRLKKGTPNIYHDTPMGVEGRDF